MLLLMISAEKYSSSCPSYGGLYEELRNSSTHS